AGALGANTAIQDVHNLAWKLASVIKQQAGPTLLDTYESERRPIGRTTVDQALLRWHSSERPSGEPGFIDDVTLMFGVRYSSAALKEEQEPLPQSSSGIAAVPGTRAPHIWLEDGRSTVDLFGPEFTLMYEDGDWAAAGAG